MWQSILTLLTPKAWIALGLVSLLAISHGTAYHYGGASVKQEWDAAVTQQVRETLRMSELNREKERILAVANQKVQAQIDTLKKTHAIDLAAANERLRSLQDALDGFASANPATPGSPDGAGGLVNELFADCAKHLLLLGGEATRLENKVIGLQEYVKGVLQNVATSKQVPTK